MLIQRGVVDKSREYFLCDQSVDAVLRWIRGTRCIVILWHASQKLLQSLLFSLILAPSQQSVPSFEFLRRWPSPPAYQNPGSYSRRYEIHNSQCYCRYIVSLL